CRSATPPDVHLAQLAPHIDHRQYRPWANSTVFDEAAGMGEQGRVSPDAVRCSPLLHAPLRADTAVELAAAFKALSDPVRLRLFSLIASHADGEACVCDLTGEFDVGQPT